MNKIKIIIMILMASFLLTGCTDSLKDRAGETVVNKETETTVIDNIICQPTDKALRELYKANGKDIDSLPTCQEINLFRWQGSIWDTFLIYPLAGIFILIGTICQNFTFAIIFFALLSRLIMFKSSIQTEKNQAKLNNLKPQIEAINKKYYGDNSSAATIAKGDELKKLYEDNKIKPFSGLLLTICTLPLFIAIIEVIYRVPIFDQTTILGLNLTISPRVGIANGNYFYLALALIIIMLAAIQSLIKTTNRKLQKRDFLSTGLIIFILSSIVFNLPSAIAIYFLCTYSLNIVERLYFRHQNQVKNKTKGNKTIK